MWGFRSRSSGTALVVTDEGDGTHEHFPLLAEFPDRRPEDGRRTIVRDRMTRVARRAIAAVAVALAVAPSAFAQAPDLPIDESVREQSCKSLQGGTAGMPEQVSAGSIAGTIPPTWPEAPAGLSLPAHVYLRT